MPARLDTAPVVLGGGWRIRDVMRSRSERVDDSDAKAEVDTVAAKRKRPGWRAEAVCGASELPTSFPAAAFAAFPAKPFELATAVLERPRSSPVLLRLPGLAGASMTASHSVGTGVTPSSASEDSVLCLCPEREAKRQAHLGRPELRDHRAASA